jgi:gamma-polyglutamate biosynthesis protein CapC
LAHFSVFYLYFSVGIMLTLIYTEITGVLPGGLIVPGYIALCITEPLSIFTILLISCVTYLIVVVFISRFVILYGRRKFTTILFVSLILKLVLDYYYPLLPSSIVELNGVGVIVPGLIANTVQKQGVSHTLFSIALISCSTFIVVTLYTIIF